MPPKVSHQVSFSRRQFFLARLFFHHDFLFSPRLLFFTTFFSPRLSVFGTTFFSARPGEVAADQYYCSGMEHMVIVIHYCNQYQNTEIIT